MPEPRCVLADANKHYDIVFIRYYKKVYDIKYCRTSLFQANGDRFVTIRNFGEKIVAHSDHLSD